MDEFKIFYSDGSTFDNTMGTPSQAPREGFVCAVGYDENNRRYIMQRWDYYRWDEPSKQFWGADLVGIIDWAKQAGIVTDVQLGSPSVFTVSDGTKLDTYGLLYWLSDNGHIFIGRTVTNSVWQQRLLAAHHDPDFPIQAKNPR